MAGRRPWGRRMVAVSCLAGLLSVTALPQAAHADNPGLLGGVEDLMGAVFALPLDTLAGTFTGPPILGTVGGALHGAFRTLGLAMRGTLKVVGFAIPFAAKAAPLIPVFL